MQEVFVVGDEPVPGYKLLENIGGSAFYRIWKVRDPQGVVKMWKEIDLVVGNAAVETRTLSLLVELRHPYLNTLTNFWEMNDGKTLVIETEAPVESVKERLQRQPNGLSLDDTHLFMRHAAEGLDFLNRPQHHFQGETVAIYHRALRPECLLIFEDRGKQICKVSDFGLAKPVTEQTAGHSQGLMHYDYDPPEFFEGQTAPTSDQYALAINYYEMRTGTLPFSGTMLEQLQARLNDRPNLTGVTEPERVVLKRALSRDPTQRFPSCVELAEALRQATATPTTTPSARQPSLRRVESYEHTPVAPAEPAATSPIGPDAYLTPREAVVKEKREIPGVVFHRRPDDAEVKSGAGERPVVPEEKAPAVPSPTDLRSFRDKLKEASGTATEISDPGGNTIPVFWVIMIVLAFVGVAAYFLSMGSTIGG